MMMQHVARPESVAVTASQTHDARILTAGNSVAQIVLDEYVYTLRITKAGKLILTK
jgi:hemin uptake protein HemP